MCSDCRRGGVSSRLLLEAIIVLAVVVSGGCNIGSSLKVGPPAQLFFSVQPSSAAAGSSIAPAVTVSIADANKHLVTTATNSVTIAIGTNPSGGTLSGTATASAVNGVATFSGLSINNVGAGYTLTASSGTGTTALAGATSNPFNIFGPAAKLAFTVQPSNVAAGSNITPAVAVSIEDAAGNVVTSSSAQVSLAIGTNPAGGTLSGTATANAVNGVATFSTLNINKVGTGYTLAASSGSLTGATSGTFNVTAGAPAKLVFTAQPTNTTAGVAISPAVQVTIEDSQGNVATSATNTITMGIGTGSGTLIGTTAVSAVSGVATFSNLNINVAGTGYTLAASATGLTGATSSSFNVTVGAAAKVIFTTEPTNVAAGSSIAPAVIVSVEDAVGNVVPTAANSITIAIGTNPSGGALSGTATVAATAGVAIFSNLSINKVGSGYTLTASAGGLTGTTSSAFNVGAGAASKLVLTTQPSNVTAGASITPPVQVTIEDSQGNVVIGATNSVTIAIGANPSSGTLSGAATAAAVAGVASFPTLSINLAGTGYTLTASASGLTGATSNPFNVIAGAAAKLAFTTQPPSSVTAGSPFGLTVSVEDALGNLVASATPSITLAVGSGSPAGALNGTTSVSASGGVATFSGLSINLAGANYTLSAAASSLGGGTSSPFTIAPAGAAKLAFTPQPVNTVVNMDITPLAVSIEDAFGNVVTSSSASVTLAIGANPSSGALGGTVTVAASSGVATFSTLTINQTGNGYTLVASSGSLTAATSTTFNILISIGPPAKLAFTVQPTNVVAGVSINPAVQVSVEDSNGNLVTSPSSTVTLSLATTPPPGTTLSGTLSVATVNGVATFNNLSINTAALSYNLQAADGSLTGATSIPFNVTPAGAAKLAFSVQPLSATAALAINPAPQVSVLDGFGNVVTSATTSITVAIASGPSTTLNGTTTVAAVSGVATFSNLIINVAGSNYTLTASASSLTTSPPSKTFTVIPGTATQLAFTVQPTNVAVNASISAVQVSFEDAEGNVVTSDTNSITMSLFTNPASATLGGTLTQAAVAGVATFSDLNLNQIGTGYKLGAIFGAFSTAVSNAFNVTAGCTTTCSLSGAVAGAWGSGVTITLSSGPATVPPTTTDSNGNYSFTGLTQGTYTITPSLEGYSYTPTPPSVSVGVNTVQNFVATSVMTSYSISGTVSGSSDATHIVYIRVYNCGGGSNCNTAAGTTLPSITTNSGTYTVRGLSPGNNYSVTAEIDTLGTGAGNEANPAGGTSGINITNANITGANIVVAAQTIDAPVTPNKPNVFPGNGSAFVSYNQPRSNTTGDEIATSYKIYYDTNSSFTHNTFKTVPSGDSNNVYVVSGLTDTTAYFFKMSAVNANGESTVPAGSVVGPVTIGATTGNFTLSGSVSFSGITPPAGSALYVGAFSNTSGVYFERIANPTNPQAYSVSGIPSGTYQQFAVLDVNGTGAIDPGSLTNFGSNGPPSLTISGSISGHSLTLTSVVAKTFVATSHQQSSGVDSYSLTFASDFGTKRPTSLTLFSGNNVAVPFDMIFDRNNSFNPIFSNSVRPLLTDAYGILVSFSDGSTPQDIPVTVSTVLDTFATSLAMNTSSPNKVSVPLLTWAAPSPLPTFNYSYSVNLNQQGGSEFWNYSGGHNSNGIPSTQTSVVFDVDNSANPSSSLTTGTYDWSVQVRDDNGNSAQIQATPYVVP